MRYVIKSSLLAVMILAICTGGHAAEGIKFKTMAPIYVDGKGSGIKLPEGVSCRGNSLLVADTGNGRILTYTMTGDILTPRSEIALPQLPYPVRVETNSKGDIFVLDGKLRKIARIAPSGEFQNYVDLAGDVLGTSIPKSFRIDKKDNLLVLDIFSARILVLDSAGKPQKQIPFPKEYGFFSDLAVDAGANVYLIDSVQRRVFKTGVDSQTIAPLSANLNEELKFPTGIATDGKGNIYLVDQNGSGIVILGPDGSLRGQRLSMGWKEGYLRYPAQMCINEAGNVFVADRGNNRIEAFLIAE